MDNNTVESNEWDILDKVNDPFVRMLRNIYSIRFLCKKELDDDQKDNAYRCLNVIAEDIKYDAKIRAWCYNQLGLILSGHSLLIPLK